MNTTQNQFWTKKNMNRVLEDGWDPSCKMSICVENDIAYLSKDEMGEINERVLL
jgi:hypothetical protein